MEAQFEQKIVEFKILKIGRKYWHCLIKGGYPCKVNFGNSSFQVEEGKTYLFLVENHSKTTSYGTNVLFKFIKHIRRSTMIGLEIKFNYYFVPLAKSINGEWDNKNKIWKFPKSRQGEVEELDSIFNSEDSEVVINNKEPFLYKGLIGSFCGMELGRGNEDNDRVFYRDNVELLSGEFTTTTDEFDDEYALMVEPDTSFRIKVPSKVLELYSRFETKWDILKIDYDC